MGRRGVFCCFAAGGGEKQDEKNDGIDIKDESRAVTADHEEERNIEKEGGSVHLDDDYEEKQKRKKKKNGEGKKEKGGSENSKGDGGAAGAAECQGEAAATLWKAVEGLREDLAKEMGYPLAARLLREVSGVVAAFEPGGGRRPVAPPPIPNRWASLHRNYEFKRALHEHAASLPTDIKSLHSISRKAVQIMAHPSNTTATKKVSCSPPEQLYLELSSFTEKGYMAALRHADPDLHSFLSLSSFFATAFIARPRLLQLTAFMLHRAREDMSIYWHTWDKMPFSWNERWHEAEPWFRAVLDCFKDRDGGDQAGLPTTTIDLAREFDYVEESARKIFGVVRTKDIGSFEQILHQFEEMKRSGLLTIEVSKLNPLCCVFLEKSQAIKDRYNAIIEMKKEIEQERKISLKSQSLPSNTKPSGSSESSRCKSNPQTPR